MTINTLHLPPESEMNHPSTIFLGTQPDTMTNPQRCSITASASRSKMPQESTTLNQSGLALGLHPWTSKRNPHRKPLIPRKALSDIPEVSSLPISPQPFVMALEKLKTISKRSLKRKLGRENLRFKSLTRRSRAKDRISRCRLRRSGSRLTSSVARASRRSESHKLWCGEEAREILAEILGETCPSSYQFPPAPPAAEVESFTVASLKLPNKRDSWLTIDSNDGWESSVSGAVRHSKSQAVEDVSGRNSLNIASGTDLEMSDENVSVKIFSRALRLPPIGIDLKETAGADGNRI
ncbi:hypothetical protein BKA65DRAFT_511845 [Rhexocercosporidium sp. MPI-PUGE-AT-0058]|nr:hypothetical protein BKA65DRAFT_511845 [Rhexocercosporidium sp. MPI-PUGE-AT-0058]